MSTISTHTAPAASATLHPTSLRTWREPVPGPPARGTLLVLVGRGETPEVYERLGRRVSADGYRVVAVGESSPVPHAVTDLAAALPAPRVVLGVDGRHDVLNDTAHRTVAALLVQFLERVRLGPDLPVVVHDVTAPAPSPAVSP